MRDEKIVELVKQGIEILDKIDEMIKTQSVELQKIDYELSDLYHLIENNELSDEASVNIIKRIHDLRKERRALNNEYEIESTYQTQKPISVLKRLIEIFTDEGDVVIDPVAGSCSTLRACAEMNRSCYGFEIKKDFCKLAKEKMLSNIKIQSTIEDFIN